MSPRQTESQIEQLRAQLIAYRRANDARLLGLVLVIIILAAVVVMVCGYYRL